MSVIAGDLMFPALTAGSRGQDAAAPSAVADSESSGNPDSLALVLRARAGDAEAFSELLQAHLHAVRHVALIGTETQSCLKRLLCDFVDEDDRSGVSESAREMTLEATTTPITNSHSRGPITLMPFFSLPLSSDHRFSQVRSSTNQP